MRNLPLWIWPLLVVPGAVRASDKLLTLDEAVKIALEQNPSTRVAGEGVNGAKEAVGEARASYYPDLGLAASYNRWQRHAFLPNGVRSEEHTSELQSPKELV